MNIRTLKKRLPKSVLIFYRYIYKISSPLFYFLNRKVKKHFYNGFPLNIYIFDEVSKSWYDHDVHRGEIEFLRKYSLKSGAKVFEIGAHHAVIALILSRIVGLRGRVIAIEMDPKHAKIANINLNNNNETNIEIVNAAAADKHRRITFERDQITNNFACQIHTAISTVTVDELTQKYGIPNILYIDVEGYEQNVLSGAKKTLLHYPDCCIEVHVGHGLEKYHGSLKGLISYFPKNKYNLYISSASDDAKFVPFRLSNNLVKGRFYLIAIYRSTKYKKDNSINRWGLRLRNLPCVVQYGGIAHKMTHRYN